MVGFDGRPVEYEFERTGRAVLAYATSIHKCRGAEYPAVVIPLHTQHFMMLQRNLLYTGITRGQSWWRWWAAARLSGAVTRIWKRGNAIRC